jgi:hypothetical protein
MKLIIGILLLAALIGILKPYLKNWTRWHFVAAVGVLAIINEVAFPVHIEGTPVTKIGEPAAKSDASTKWSYADGSDKMRGTTEHQALITSDNQVNLDFPYGVQGGKLEIRRRSKDGLDVMFYVDKGQILCSRFQHSFISAKFDDGPIVKYGCSGASDGSDDVAFILGAPSFVSHLKNAKSVIIEAEFFQKGRQQFTFGTKGLIWK